MELDIKIGHYQIMQRTQFSKIRLLDMNKNEDITEGSEDILEKILFDYNRQIENPEKYFKINNNDVLEKFEDRNFYKLEYIFIPFGVKQIYDFVFKNSTVKMVSIPNTVKSIGGSSFENSRILEAINLSDNIISIEDSTFKDCLSLKQIKLPDSLESISNWAFCGCRSLDKVEFSDSITSIGSYVFSKCNQIKTIKLPKQCFVLGAACFSNCKNLENVVLGDKLEIIGEDCFANCLSLKEITIPNSVKNISPTAFYNCGSLISLNLVDTSTDKEIEKLDGDNYGNRDLSL